MALVLNDRVKESTTTTGTGTISLGGALTNFESFVSAIGDGNTTYYAIVNRSSAEFEIGLGTITDADPDTLARNTIISSSNSDSAVNFSAGTKDVFCTLPASKAVFEDGSNNVAFNGAITGVTNLTASGEIDAATLDISGNADIDGTLEADAITLNGTALSSTFASLSGDNTFTGDISVGDDLTVLGGVIEFKSNSGSPASLKMYCESSNAHFQTLQPQPHSASAANTLRLPDSGDSGTQDLVAVDITQTLTNKSIDSDNNTITNIVNADIKSSAAIADSKLATISTAGKVALTALEIDGGSDIGADLTTSDLIIVDDGAGGTNKKAALSRVVTLMQAQGFSTEDPTALAIALG
tara:strand:- start:1493 stop:2554 length:1062 start_codon:yes stop_codon:yes gene_type:complete